MHSYYLHIDSQVDMQYIVFITFTINSSHFFLRAVHSVLKTCCMCCISLWTLLVRLKWTLHPGLKTLHTDSVYPCLYSHSPSNFSALITTETGIRVRVYIMCIYAPNAKVFLPCQWTTEQTSGRLSSYTCQQSRKLLLFWAKCLILSYCVYVWPS